MEKKENKKARIRHRNRRREVNKDWEQGTGERKERRGEGEERERGGRKRMKSE